MKPGACLVDFEQRLEYLDFASRLLGVSFIPSQVSWLTSLDSSGRVLGVAVFSRFNDSAKSCEITVASVDPRFLSRRFFKTGLAYVFGQCEIKRVTAFIAVENEKSLNLARQLGFQVEGRARKWFASGDAWMLGLLPDECKWLEAFNGLTGSPASS